MKSKRKLVMIGIMLLLAAGAGFGYYLWNQKTTTTASAQTTRINTSAVKTGSITLSADGTGTLVASQEKKLNFAVKGTVGAVNVQVGDQVKKGDVLAELSDLDTLETALVSAQADQISAQKALTTLKNSAKTNLANAELSLLSAQKAFNDAKSGVKLKGAARCDADTTKAYWDKYLKIKDQLDFLGDGGGNADLYLTKIEPLKTEAATAYTAYIYCAKFTEYEIASSTGTLALKELALKDAETKLADLKANNGIDTNDLALAENKVANARIGISKAQKNLDGSKITAPIDGTVISVAGQVGEDVDTTTFITVADLAHPQVQFYIDETDFDKIAVGNPVKITFDAITDKEFSGKVLKISPSLSTGSGYAAIQALAELTLDGAYKTRLLPAGLNAAVEVVGDQALNVLVVPVEALRALGDNQYSVFVVDANGNATLRTVEIGLQDVTNVEIKSGLSLGELVSTGVVEMK
jgi:HlyD family secretion protein